LRDRNVTGVQTCALPISVTTFDGFRTTNSELKSLLRTMGATKRDIFIKLEIPSALPYFFSGLKVAIPMSVVGAAIGEWLGADEGDRKSDVEGEGGGRGGA